MPKIPRVKRNKEVVKHDILVFMNKGCGWGEACRKVGISRSYGYKLRNADTDFAAEAERLLASPIHQQRMVRSSANSEALATNDWRRQFIVQYRITGDRSVAADAVEKSVVELEDMMNPDHDSYDEELAALMREEEVRYAWDLEDKARRSALEAKNTAMQKFLLEKLVKEKFGKAPEENKSLNLYFFSKEQETRALDALDVLFSESTEDAQRLLEAG
jgi:hypothetical protein